MELMIYDGGVDSPLADRYLGKQVGDCALDQQHFINSDTSFVTRLIAVCATDRLIFVLKLIYVSDANALELTMEVLSRNGFLVTAAKSPHEALRKHARY